MFGNKILIVEDEAVVALYIKQQLKKYNYDVVKYVGTGEKAIQIAKEQNPDYILMDIRLASRMDGIQAAKEIASFSDSEIIFMSGYQDPEIVERVHELKRPLLAKPVEIHQILECLSR